jgi:hypothetical protein
MNEYTDNYRSIVATATPAQIEMAVQWYADAEILAHDLVRIYADRGIVANLEQCASVISAFSPRERWSSNVAKATEFAMGGKPRGLTNNLRMAENALRKGFDALNGMKTNAFARAIAGDENAVTIDVWMCRAAGVSVDSPNVTLYRNLVQACNTIATEINLTPRATQALIWIIYRGSAV